MAKTKKQSESEKLCDAIVEGMQDNKAKDIVVLDLRGIESSVCDFFVICTGESTTQFDGIAESVARFTRKNLKQRPWHTEGKTKSEWGLLDYIDVVAHVFYKETRTFFDLEDLWSDAIRKDIQNLN